MKEIPEELLKAIVHRLVEGMRPEKVILFGSHARGCPVEDSDIDLLVVIPETNEPRYRRARRAYACLWGISAPVEVIVATSQEIEEASRSPTSFLGQAIQYGRLLYGRSEAT